MRSSEIFFFAFGAFVRRHLVEALPLADDNSLSTGRSDIAAKIDGSIKLLADRTIPPPMPLKAFGTFKAHSLQDVIEDPALVYGTSVPDHVPSSSSSSSSTGGSKAAVKEFAAAASCTNPQIRIEWRNYSDADRKAFVDAISCLTNLPSAGTAFSPSTSRYEDFAQTHQKLTPKVHGDGIFLLWHRYFVYTFEQALRTQCGFNRSLPWWDETKDSGKL